HLTGLSRSPPRRNKLITATMIGVEAISSPVSELLMPRSASDRANHGMMISTRANSISHGHTGLSALSCLPRSANGSSSAAPRATRASTRTGTETPPTATLINRYGRPQMTPIAANRTHPRRLTDLVLSVPTGARASLAPRGRSLSTGARASLAPHPPTDSRRARWLFRLCVPGYARRNWRIIRNQPSGVSVAPKPGRRQRRQGHRAGPPVRAGRPRRNWRAQQNRRFRRDGGTRQNDSFRRDRHARRDGDRVERRGSSR